MTWRILRRGIPLLAVLLILVVAAEARIITRPRRRGPDLAERWTNAVRTIGSVEIDGTMTAPNRDAIRIEGRLGAGALMIAIGAPPDDASAWAMLIKMDEQEAEIQERATGWILRRRISEIKAPLSEEGDFFGFLPPVSIPAFHGENNRHEQIWEYDVKGGIRYRVWLADAPLRMLRRDVIRPGQEYPTTFLYEDFISFRPSFFLPRRIKVESTGDDQLLDIRLEFLQSRPPLGKLPPLSVDQRNLFRTGERILADTSYRAIARRVISSPVSASDGIEVLEALDSMEDSFGIHPLIDILRARFALSTGDTPLAGASIRAASSLGHVIMPLTARIGAMEFLDAGDSTLMMKALQTCLPDQPGGLPEMGERLLVEVTEEIAGALMEAGRETEALHAMQRAALHAPGNRSIAFLRARHLLDLRRETEAVLVLKQLVAQRPNDQRCVLHFGDLLERLEHSDEADSLYAQAMQTHPSESVFPLRRARLFIAKKDRIAAEDLLDATWRSILLADMNAHRRADLANEIAWLMVEGNLSLVKARRLIDHALSVSPEDPFYMDTLGMIQLRNGNRMAAIMIFERALKRLDDPEIREHLNQARH